MQKESSTRQKFIGSLTQMTTFMYIQTPPSHVVRKLSEGLNLLIQELYVRQAQVLQKPTDNNGHMITLENYPIPFQLTIMTIIMIIMTQMLTSMKNSSKEEIDRTKSFQHKKKKKKKKVLETSLSLSLSLSLRQNEMSTETKLKMLAQMTLHTV